MFSGLVPSSLVLEESAPYDRTHARARFDLPIRIDSNDDWAAHNIPGSGTEWDPYIIEKSTINGSICGYCIYIGNSTKHFVISGCALISGSLNGETYSWNSGVAVYNSTNGTIIGNTFISGERAVLLNMSKGVVVKDNSISPSISNGIKVHYGSKNVVLNNSIGTHTLGVEMSNTDDSIVAKNHIYTNSVISTDVVGISIVSSDRNQFYGNTFSGINYGVNMNLSNNNLFVANNISRCTYGVNVNECKYSYFSNNNISCNAMYGLYFGNRSMYNTVVYNRFYGNVFYAVHVDTYLHTQTSEYNVFHHNAFVSNYIPLCGQCADYGLNETWYTDRGGNFWANFTTPDLNGDGYVDDPYNYSIDGGYHDEMPLSRQPPSNARENIRINNNLEFNISNGVINPWVSGDITAPYIIDGWDINGSMYDSCAYVGNTTKYFILRNCSLHEAKVKDILQEANVPYNWKAGAALFNVVNGNVSENVMTDNTRGAYIDNSTSVNITGNFPSSNSIGIEAHYSEFCNISNNICSGNALCGIMMSDCSNCRITSNIAASSRKGIVVSKSSFTILYANNVYLNSVGYSLVSSNTITLDSDIASNNSIGAAVNFSYECSIIKCNFSNNSMADLSLADGTAHVVRDTNLSGTFTGLEASNVTGCTFERLRFYGVTNGVYMTASNRVLVNNCTAANGHTIIGTGFAFISSANCTIVNNSASKMNMGISLTHASFCKISSNVISASNTGIELVSSFNNSILDNIASNGMGSGYGCTIESSHDNTLDGNSFTMCYLGLELIANSSKNSILYNNISSNAKHGAFLDNSSDNENVFGFNEFYANDGFGIFISSGPSANFVHHNNFTYNNGSTDVYDPSTIQALDAGLGNIWNDVSEGNRWSDWTTPDILPPYGIVDIPYNISGAANSMDNFPLIKMGNIPPTLSECNVTPTQGNTTTVFTYRVKYADPDGNAPIMRKIEIDGTQCEMAYKSGNNCTGAMYEYSTTLSVGMHNYSFIFDDGNGSNVRFPAFGALEGPYVSDSANSPPLLAGPAFTPQTGNSSTLFTFSINYSDADGDAPLNRTIYIDEVPHQMTFLAGDNRTCAIYYFITTLPTGAHTYRFRFDDGNGSYTIFPPTGSLIGPTVIENAPPSLSEPGVTPQSGTPETIFKYTVIYSDPDGDAPSSASVIVDGVTYTMEYISGSNRTGATYEFVTTLSEGGHTYSFYFMDANGTPITYPVPSAAGPNVTPSDDNPPVLYGAELFPNEGNWFTQFKYRVFYLDFDGDAPTSHSVAIDGVNQTMNYISGDNSSGAMYEFTISGLGLGNHTYKFYFANANCAVEHPLGDTFYGPFVTNESVPGSAAFKPLGGIYAGGSSITICWEKANVLLPEFMLYYSTDEFNSVNISITEHCIYDTNYIWTLPMLDGKVSFGLLMQSSSATFWTTSGSITVDSTKPTISLASPQNGSCILSNATLSFLISDAHISSVNATIFVNGAAWTNVVLSSPYDISLGELSTGNALAVPSSMEVRLSASDLAGNYCNSSFVFDIHAIPEISLVSPTESTFEAGNDIVFQLWDASSAVCILDDGAPKPFQPPYRFPTASLEEGQHKLTIIARSGCFEVARNMSFFITSPQVHNEAPKVVGMFDDVILKDRYEISLDGKAEDADDTISNLTWRAETGSPLFSAMYDANTNSIVLKRSGRQSGEGNLTITLLDPHGANDTRLVRIVVPPMKVVGKSDNFMPILMLALIAAGIALMFFIVVKRRKVESKEYVHSQYASGGPNDDIGHYYQGYESVQIAPHEERQSDFKASINKSSAETTYEHIQPLPTNAADTQYSLTAPIARTPPHARERPKINIRPARDNAEDKEEIPTAVVASSLVHENGKGPKVISQLEASKLENLFLVYCDGRMIERYPKGESDLDMDTIASMLTAVQDFVKDSFQGKGSGINSIKYGHTNVIIERGVQMYLVAVISGPEPSFLRSGMRRVLISVRDKYPWVTKHKWSGELSEFEGAYDLLETYVGAKFLDNTPIAKPAEVAEPAPANETSDSSKGTPLSDKEKRIIEILGKKSQKVDFSAVEERLANADKEIDELKMRGLDTDYAESKVKLARTYMRSKNFNKADSFSKDARAELERLKSSIRE